MIIAIDGPSGAGKSTVARRAAAQLGFVYIDTGALYRTIGLAVLRRGASTKDVAAVEQTLPELVLNIEYIDNAQHVILNGEDVSEAIRTPEASLAASDVGGIPAVRAYLLELQRTLARAQNSILAGRDIGTVVLPDADVKIFLTASAAERAARRHKELHEKGIAERYEKVLAEIEQRDFQDANRAIAPLKPAQDSILVDTTGLSLEEAITKVVQLIQKYTTEVSYERVRFHAHQPL